MKLPDFASLFCGVLLNAFAQLGLKAATRDRAADGGDGGAAAPLAGDSDSAVRCGRRSAAYGLSVIVWVVGLSRVPVSQAYPMLSLGYVINVGSPGGCSARRRTCCAWPASRVIVLGVCTGGTLMSKPFLPFTRPTIDEETIAGRRRGAALGLARDRAEGAQFEAALSALLRRPAGAQR